MKFDFNNRVQSQHYCRLTGKLLGNAHESCVQRAESKTNSKFIHTPSHNLEGYDSHIFINDLINNSEKKISVITQTNKNFGSITYSCVKFLDSLKLLMWSLDELSKS